MLRKEGEAVGCDMSMERLCGDMEEYRVGQGHGGDGRMFIRTIMKSKTICVSF